MDTDSAKEDKRGKRQSKRKVEKEKDDQTRHSIDPAILKQMLNDRRKRKEEQEESKEKGAFLTSVIPDNMVGDTCKTYLFKNEGHSLGNVLRNVILNYPETIFCGYTIPHPAEKVMHLRIQCSEGVTTLELLKRALIDIQEMCDVTRDAFKGALDEFGVETGPFYSLFYESDPEVVEEPAETSTPQSTRKNSRAHSAKDKSK